MCILLVEDEPELSTILKKGLEENGYSVDVAGEGEEGLYMAENFNVDLIALDIVLPKIDGLTLLSKIREKGMKTPVILLTARDTLSDKIKGLDVGADDYLTKPFEFTELLARIRALLRRGREVKEALIKVADLEINTANHEVRRKGKSISLTAGEYSVPLSGHYFQVVSSDGMVLARSPSLSIVDATLPVREENTGPDYELIVGPDKTPLRMLSQSFQTPSGRMTIQASESMEEVYQLLNSFRNTLLLVFSIFFAMSGMGILFITNRSLKPLETFSGNISHITEKNLYERVEESRVDLELKPLAKSFNTTLGRLEKSFQKQRRFLSDASHELRTPTAVIKGYCDVTLGKKRSTSEYKEALTKIGESINKMSDIINRILMVSRLESGSFSVKRELLDLPDLMSHVLKHLKYSIEKKKVLVHMSGEKVRVTGDRERLTEAFINIVENAVKYNQEGGRIDIHIQEKEKWKLVTITDTGVGIPDGEIGKIFDRFYRVDSNERGVKGSGLGLSIAIAIIEAHHGRIEVKSDLGKGSRFIIFLPREWVVSA